MNSAYLIVIVVLAPAFAIGIPATIGFIRAIRKECEKE